MGPARASGGGGGSQDGDAAAQTPPAAARWASADITTEEEARVAYLETGSPELSKLWWAGGAETDALITTRFGHLLKVGWGSLHVSVQAKAHVNAPLMHDLLHDNLTCTRMLQCDAG